MLVIVASLLSLGGAAAYAGRNAVAVFPSLFNAPSPTYAALAPLVRVEGGVFALGCDVWRPVGFCSYTLLDAAAELPCGSWSASYEGTGRAMIVDTFAMAQRLGINYIRMWAFSLASGYPLQIAPGVYDDTMFQALDFVLDQAGKHGIRVSLVLTDWWQHSGGVQEYVQWSHTALSSTDFFTDESCKRMYQLHAVALITRVNSINGLLYRDDPAILGWELMNEPRCRGCAAEMQRWIEEMAAFVAHHDPFHLRTVGSEGFWSSSSESSEYAMYNPAAWASTNGQDFIINHASPNVTHTTTHVWPGNWQSPFSLTSYFTGATLRGWVEGHILASAALKRPLILSEFGQSLASFNPLPKASYFNLAWALVEDSVSRGHVLQGSSFWAVFPKETRQQTQRDGFSVFLDDPVLMPRLSGHAAALRRQQRKVC